MKFKYSARTQSGELQTGFVEGVNRETAFNTLTGHDLYILSLESTEIVHWYDRLLSIFKRVKQGDLMVFTRQFAILLDAKISLGDALRSLYRQTHNATLKEAIFEISSDIDSGLSLSQSLERHNQIFSSFYISMMRSAEVTGRMEEVASFLADFLEKENTLLSKVRSAMIYPAVVIGLFMVVVGIMIGFVFPQLQPVFAEANVKLPPVTAILLATGTFVSEWWFVLLIVAIIMAVMILDYIRTPEGKIVFDELVVKVPVIGDLFKKMYVTRFAESTSVLIKGGIPVAQALEISGHTVGSVSYRDAIHEVAESVRQGQLLSQALEERPYFFPPLVSQMVAVGETTGKLDELLTRVSMFYNREVDGIISNLVELIQPLLMVGIGVMVGLLFAAVLLPIYNLVQVF
ncbi:MAG TPA: type II secretion system F family protein [Candidatus Paceibacterota bacterium]